MSVGPGFLFPLLHKIKEAFPFKLLMGDGALELDFPLSHLDDLPVTPPGAALDEDLVSHLGRVGVEYHDPMAILAALRHGVLLFADDFSITGLRSDDPV
jgi:hypothetical protein